MKSTVEALEGNKVKVTVEVDEQEFDSALDAAFRRIAKEVRIPGFRPGKVPRRILEARIGTEAARQDALRESLPEYYVRAVDEHDVDVIAPPEIDITAGQEAGPVTFDAVVEVRPKITIQGYNGLRVEVPSPLVTDDDIASQLDRLRDQSGTLETVDRPAQEGDYVSIDIAASQAGQPIEGLTADDYLYEVGSGTAVPELDEHVTGAKVGDILVFDAAHPDPEQTEPLSFRVLVKEVKEKVLPDESDEWAAEVSEFDTLVELRDDLVRRMEGIKRVQAALALRQGTLDALVELVTDEPPEAMVNGEITRRIEDLSHRLSHQGITLEQWLQYQVEESGMSPQEFLDDLRVQATGAVKADLAIRAVVDAHPEAVEIDDEALHAEFERIAPQVGQSADEVRAEFERAGRIGAVRSDLQRSKALEWLVESAEVVDPDGNTVDRKLLEPPASDDNTEEEERTSE